MSFQRYDLRSKMYKPFKTVEELSEELKAAEARRRLASSFEPTALASADGRTHVYVHFRRPFPKEWEDNDRIVIHQYDDGGNLIN